ncbi:hypothetical protein Ciccas_012952 [Cichlidogyrus casuarinus]|uniref:Uncharacterized protein n=1 Tax=Cichlidogyrus casuarinus TaxID=1844966 RepID=A0ABD2PMZ1_9PLAT
MKFIAILLASVGLLAVETRTIDVTRDYLTQECSANDMDCVNQLNNQILRDERKIRAINTAYNELITELSNLISVTEDEMIKSQLVNYKMQAKSQQLDMKKDLEKIVIVLTKAIFEQKSAMQIDFMYLQLIRNTFEKHEAISKQTFGDLPF